MHYSGKCGHCKLIRVHGQYMGEDLGLKEMGTGKEQRTYKHEYTCAHMNTHTHL